MGLLVRVIRASLLVLSLVLLTVSDVGPGISEEIIEKAPHCEKALVNTDTAIVEMDIVYQHGDLKVSGLPPGNTDRLHSINLSGREVLKPLRDGMVGMCVGEKKRLVIPPNLAYGDMELKLPDGRKTPAKSTVIATIKVIQILRQTEREKEGIFLMLDLNKDGKIDKKELMSVYGTYSKVTGASDKGSFDTMIDSAFILLDKDKNGYVEKNELLSSLPTGTSGMSAKVTNNVLQLLSTRGIISKSSNKKDEL